MEISCLAQSSGALCFTLKPENRSGVVAIAQSVGAGGTNVAADVRTIQSALNDLSAESGKPNPPLKVDGMVGPKTGAAIKGFQQTHVRVVDSRIDPGGATLAALNVELSAGEPVAAQGTAAGSRVQAGRTPEFLPPDPAVTALVVSLLVKVRDVIRAANFQCTAADPFITTRKLIIPTGPFQASARQSLTVFDKVFSLGKFDNPRPHFENIRRVYRNMDVALNRSFETAPLIAPVLFVPNTHLSMEAKAAAYTSVGGAFLSNKEKFADLPEPANRIYVCRNMLTDTVAQQVSALVHELAHYVSGQPIRIGDVVKKGRMFSSAGRPSFDAIRPDQKIVSAEHYSFFALVSRFPSFL